MKHSLLTWNLQWATATSWRYREIAARLKTANADVAVLTEAQIDVATSLYRHVVHTGPHPRANKPRGSKVIVASDHPIEPVDLVGSPDLPEKNFAAVDVELPDGILRVIGVVVRYNQKTEYIDALPRALDGLAKPASVVAGDFNLSMDTDKGLNGRLRRVLAAEGLRVVTEGPWPELRNERPLIDHIAVGSAIDVRKVSVWPRRESAGTRQVSDHAGVMARMSSVEPEVASVD